MSAHAKANPDKFYIGTDANAKALEKPSMKATRKPAKGGLPNAIFIQAAVEDLPAELNGIANQIHINFPWGSLLRAVAVGHHEVLASLRRIAAPGASIRAIVGIDPVRDGYELERLGLFYLDDKTIDQELIPRFASAGFRAIELRELPSNEWSKIETSWAKKLGGNDARTVYLLHFESMP